MIFVSYDFCLYHRGDFCPLFWRGSGVDLNNADLQDINLTSTDLPESTFIIFGEKYFISICGDNVRVGCEVHSASEWRQFSKQDIIDMGDN